MKKALSIILAVVMVASVLPFSLTASAEVTSGTTGDCTWTLDGTILTISGNGKMENYYVEYYNNYKYHSVNYPWSTLVTEVIIEDGVTSIGDCAFYEFIYLTSITIPNSVISIGDEAFYGCKRLTNITIPNSLASVGVLAFSNCTSLTSITIPNSATSIGSYAFSNCTGLTSVTIGNSVTIIGNYAFSSCTGLTSITLPNSITSISKNTFSGCTGLTNITIPDNITSIGSDAFYNCSSLKNVYITDISAWCNIEFSDNPLYYAENLYINGVLTTDLVIPNDVTSIGNRAFYSFDGITSVTIGNGVTSIGSSAFSGCTGLTSISIPSNLKNIDPSAFNYCSGLEKIEVEEGNAVYYSKNNCLIETASKTLILGCNTSIIPSDGSVTSIGGSAFSGCTGLTSINIPNSVTSIGSYSFENCTRLTSLTIGNGVTSIGSYAFDGCSSLDNVYITDISAWCNIDFSGNPLYYAENLYVNGVLTTDLVIPNDVTSIGNAFYSFDGITSVTIGDGVISIGGGAFAGCLGLTSVTIGNSVLSIGDDAFTSCSNLKSIILPKSVKNIGYSYVYEGWNDGQIVDDIWYSGSEADKNNIDIDYYGRNMAGTFSVLRGATWHYNTCDVDKHIYTGECDAECNSCEWIRSVTVEHTFDNDCDAECNICGKNREISHQYEWVVDQQATCSVNGIKHEECTICHAKISEGTSIPATGNHIGGEATCVAKAKCNVCGAEYGEIDINIHKNTEVRGQTAIYSGDIYCLDCGVMVLQGEMIGKYGDVNGDEELSATDALAILHAIVGKITFTEGQEIAADVDGNGEISSIDALLILQLIVGKFDKFPVEK